MDIEGGYMGVKLGLGGGGGNNDANKQTTSMDIEN